MPDITGKSVRIYMGDGGAPEVFTLIGTSTLDELDINNTLVEKNSKDSGGWRELFPPGSIRSLSMAISGIFTDSAVQEALRQLTMSADPQANFRFHFGGTRRIVGAFQVSNYKHSGATEGFAQFSAQFESTGVMTEEAAS